MRPTVQLVTSPRQLWLPFLVVAGATALGSQPVRCGTILFLGLITWAQANGLLSGPHRWPVAR